MEKKQKSGWTVSDVVVGLGLATLGVAIASKVKPVTLEEENKCLGTLCLSAWDRCSISRTSETMFIIKGGTTITKKNPNWGLEFKLDHSRFYGPTEGVVRIETRGIVGGNGTKHSAKALMENGRIREGYVNIIYGD